MKNFAFLCMFCLLTGCSVLGPGEFDFEVEIVEVENTPDGVRLTFRVDSDGEDIMIAGAAYGRDSLFDITRNQESAYLLPSGLFEVILPNADDGVVYFQAFAGFDAFYELSEVVSFTVISQNVNPPCSPSVNTLRVNLSDCSAPGQASLSTQTTRDDNFEVRLVCNRGERSELVMVFPRDPTSGVYRLTSDLHGVPPRTKVFRATFQLQSTYTGFRSNQEVYVNRSADYTEITVCDLEFPIFNTTRTVTTKIRYER